MSDDSYGGKNPAQGGYRHAGGRSCRNRLALLSAIPAVLLTLAFKANRKN